MKALNNLHISNVLTVLQLTIILISSFLFFIAINWQMTKNMNQNINDSMERELLSIDQNITSLLDMHVVTLKDISQQPLFTQTLMQPEQHLTAMQDWIKTIKILGQSYQLTLTNFQGKTLCSSWEFPKFDYKGTKWIDKLISTPSHIVSISESQGKFFWQIACSIVFKNFCEGVLIVEVPIEKLNLFSFNTKNRAFLNIMFNKKKIHQYGKEVSGISMSKQSHLLPQLSLVYGIDNTFIKKSKKKTTQNTIILTLLLSLSFSLLLIFVNRKIIVNPLLNFQKRIATFHETNNYSPKESSFSFHELNELNNHFNNMAASIEERTRELNELNRSLETKVRERTESLKMYTVTLEKKNQELKNANKYKSEFMANISHEIRTPLNGLIMLSKTLMENKKRNLTGKQVKMLKIIHQGGLSLLQLLSDILDFSKIESGNMNVENLDLSVNEIISNVTQQFQYVAIEKQLDFQTICDPNVPEIIQSDSLRLTQVLNNFLSNAFKFTRKGAVTLHVKYDDNNSKIVFSVKDTGIGIPKEKQENIFLAFTQADGSTTRHYGGTGLGLTICMQLAKLLGGEILLESAEDQGSCFSLELIHHKTNTFQTIET